MGVLKVTEGEIEISPEDGSSVNKTDATMVTDQASPGSFTDERSDFSEAENIRQEVATLGSAPPPAQEWPMVSSPIRLARI